MAHTDAEARQQLLDAVAAAIEEIGFALGSLGEAYEQLDEASADRLEEELFRPVQLAFGRARRTHDAFADRHGLPGRVFTPAVRGAPSHRAKGFVDDAVEAVAEADAALSTLQDSMVPIEWGDPELRAGLEEVRTLLASIAGRARQFLRTLGR
jgi:hypothetical protein